MSVKGEVWEADFKALGYSNQFSIRFQPLSDPCALELSLRWFFSSSCQSNLSLLKRYVSCVIRLPVGELYPAYGPFSWKEAKSIFSGNKDLGLTAAQQSTGGCYHCLHPMVPTVAEPAMRRQELPPCEKLLVFFP